jgi:hypothetical protein
MGKKSAHTGMSPKDRSINLMDKFITRNQNKNKDMPFRSAIRKDPNIPIDQWPLKDQIEYWENRTDADRFDTSYPIYSYWIDAVRQTSKVHPTFFADCTLKLKPMLQEMYDNKVSVREAVTELRKHGVY